MKLFLDTNVSSLDAPVGGAGPDGDEGPNLSAIKSLQYEAFSLPVEDRILLEQGLKSLSDLQRKVVYLFFYKDLSARVTPGKTSVPPPPAPILAFRARVGRAGELESVEVGLEMAA